MKQSKKFIIKIYLTCFTLAISSVIVFNLTQSKELLLVTRLIGSAFFAGMYLWIESNIKKQDKMIKDSNGFLEKPFDPKFLKLTLLLFVIGWTSFAVMDYFGMNFMDWIFVFTLGIIIIPVSMGLIPLRLKDNKWKR